VMMQLVTANSSCTGGVSTGFSHTLLRQSRPAATGPWPLPGPSSSRVCPLGSWSQDAAKMVRPAFGAVGGGQGGRHLGGRAERTKDLRQPHGLGHLVW
jgi:hypothetical protein